MQLRDGSSLTAVLVTIGWLLCPEAGRAQPVASAVDPSAGDPPRPPREGREGREPIVAPAPRPVREPTATDVAGAPIPGQESGRLDRDDDHDSPQRLIGRGFLFLPRIAIMAAVAPIRAGIWANAHYRIDERAHDTLFNKPRTMGLYPTLGYASSYGVTIGARFVDRDLFGGGEQLSFTAMAGGQFRRLFEASFRTGDLPGERVHLELKGLYDRRSKERFYGIGNGDEAREGGAEGTPIDPRIDPTSVETRYGQQLLRATAIADLRIAGDLHLLGSGALSRFLISRGEGGPPIDEVYLPDALVGWSGTDDVYTELELHWDSRRSVSAWEPRPIYTAGWFAGAYGGRVHRLDGGPDFWRYGGEVQRFMRIGRGPRVIAARVHAEAVSGSRGEVPFYLLPGLGGSRLLRGYETERFRDRIAAVGSLDYEWDLSQLFSARLFADAGRVYASADELTAEGLRVAYGVGIDMHTQSSFWLRTSLASSIDGGVFLNLTFEPVFEIPRRAEQR